jgi:catabolite repression HPr-like protein
MKIKEENLFMIKKSIKVQISNGLEARPVALLVQVASQFESAVYVEADTKRINAKSIMGMMTLGLNEGECVTISAEGADEQEAMQGIEQYLSGSVA